MFPIVNTLYSQFSVEASNVLADLQAEFMMFNSSSTDIQQELQKKAIVSQSRHLNSWESSLYQALSQSQWYCRGGFR